jgi:hypothetical protein
MGDDSTQHSKPKTVAVATARTDEQRISSELQGWAAVRGARTTVPGPFADTDGVNVRDGYVMRHLWTLYDGTDSAMGDGFHRVHSALAANGWKVTKFGPADDEARTPEIEAQDPNGQYRVEVDWDHPDKKQGAQLRFTVTSRIFVAPKGSESSAP